MSKDDNGAAVSPNFGYEATEFVAPNPKVSVARTEHGSAESPHTHTSNNADNNQPVAKQPQHEEDPSSGTLIVPNDPYVSAERDQANSNQNNDSGTLLIPGGNEIVHDERSMASPQVNTASEQTASDADANGTIFSIGDQINTISEQRSELQKAQAAKQLAPDDAGTTLVTPDELARLNQEAAVVNAQPALDSEGTMFASPDEIAEFKQASLNRQSGSLTDGEHTLFEPPPIAAGDLSQSQNLNEGTAYVETEGTLIRSPEVTDSAPVDDRTVYVDNGRHAQANGPRQPAARPEGARREPLVTKEYEQFRPKLLYMLIPILVVPLMIVVVLLPRLFKSDDEPIEVAAVAPTAIPQQVQLQITAIPPTPIPTNIIVNTPIPTDVPPTQPPTIAPVVAELCDYRIELSSDKTVRVEAGQYHKAQWQFRNMSACDIPAGFSLQHRGGVQFGDRNSIPVQSPIPPNGQVNLDVEFISPNTLDTYAGTWAFVSTDGSEQSNELMLIMQVVVPPTAVAPPTVIPSPTPLIVAAIADSSTPVIVVRPTDIPTQTPIPTETPEPTATTAATTIPLPTETPEPTATTAATATATTAATATATMAATATATNTATPQPTTTPTRIAPTSTPSPTRTPWPTKTPAPTWTPTATRTPLPTRTPVPTWTPIPSRTPWPTKTATPTRTPLPTRTPFPTNTPVPTWTPTRKATPWPTNTPVPTWTPTRKATSVPAWPTARAATPVPTWTPTPWTAPTAWATPTPWPTATPATSGALRWRYTVTACRYSDVNWECDMLIDVAGGSGQYTIEVSDKVPASTYFVGVGQRKHTFSARRCTAWVHSVTVTDNVSGESANQGLYLSPTEYPVDSLLPFSCQP